MMRSIPALVALATSVVLAGCAGGGGLLDRNRPDEFAVSRQAPLVIPPDYTLSPPKPGAPRPQDNDSSRQALDALFGGPSPRSQVEGDALSRAGTASPGIRSSVGDPQTNTVSKGAVTRDILSAPAGDGREAQSSIPTS
jgi:hypothetical protein